MLVARGIDWHRHGTATYAICTNLVVVRRSEPALLLLQ